MKILIANYIALMNLLNAMNLVKFIPLLAFDGTGVKHPPKDFICCQYLGISFKENNPYDEFGFDKEGVN